MPRARNIKYGFFTNDELADNHPLGRLMFIGMWTLADYKGDLEWNPRRMKVQLLPYDDCDVVSLAINLDKSGFIRFYSNQDKIYLRVVNFALHQNPHKNEKQQGSDIPEFSEQSRQVIDFNTLTINRDLSRIDHDKNETNPADSLSLIPDSLSLNRDIVELKRDAAPEVNHDSVFVIEYLNRVASKKFKHTASHAKFINARFREGRTVKDLCAVVDRKCQEWLGDPKMSSYIRPQTLFSAEKFDGYLSDVGKPIPAKRQGQFIPDNTDTSWADGFNPLEEF
jgi:uncharacterized phage protein (TIGR02220 family)